MAVMVQKTMYNDQLYICSYVLGIVYQLGIFFFFFLKETNFEERNVRTSKLFHEADIGICPFRIHGLCTI